MSPLKPLFISVAVASGLTALQSLPAAAQSSAATAPPGGLEEVTVTARKRAESLQDAPLTVSAISQDRIEKFDITTIENVASMTPQLFVGRSSNGSGAQMTIRGIGSSSTSIGIEQSVAIIVDGAYYGQGRVLNEGMFDMAQIEILKGPQSLFFGKNATAGVISFTTRKPTQDLEAQVKAGYEFESDEQRYEGFVSGPITDTLGARLALKYTNQDNGWFQNKSKVQPYDAFDVATGNIISDIAPADNRDAPGEEELIGRLTFAWDPTDDLSTTLSLAKNNAKVRNSSWNYTAFNCPGGVGGLNPDLKCGDHFVITQNRMPSLLADSLPYAKSNGDLYNDYDSSAATLNLEYRFGAFTLNSITNYQENSNKFGLSGDFQSIPTATFATEKNSWDAFSEELRLSSQFDGSLNFMVGMLYQETSRKFDQWVSTGGLANSLAPEPSLVYVASVKKSSTDGETLSPFFELTWDITDSLTFSGGARYTDEKKKSDFVHPYNNPGLAALWRTNEVAKADQSFDEWSPEATLSWQATDDVMAYVAYKTAYKSGGFSNSGIYATAANGGSVSDFTFDPETAKGFEAGIKSTLLDNQLRLNVTAYTYEYEDLQVDFFNSPSFAFITLNAGKAKTDGAEAEVEYAPFALGGLTLRGSLAYNKAEYDNFIAPCWAGQTAAQGCNTIVPTTVSTPGQDISGDPTAMAPEWSASFGVNYDGYFDNGWGYGFALDGLYSDSYNASAFANPHAERDAYTTYNASVYLAGSDGLWQVDLMGKNLSDEHIVSGVVDGPSTPVEGGAYADQMGFTSLPRTVVLQLTLRYN